MKEPKAVLVVFVLMSVLCLAAFVAGVLYGQDQEFVCPEPTYSVKEVV